MQDNRITKLFGIQYPIVQGGMIWVSGARLAAAVSNAGGLGLIGAGSMSPELLREHIRKLRGLTDRPFGVNLPIFSDRSSEKAQVIIEEGVNIVFSSGGSPKALTPLFKEKGCTVIHVTSTPALARKCEAAGVDGVVCEGFEAGGHNGRAELTTLVLVPQVVDVVSIPVLAAGGIGDGRGMAAAMALGADGVQIGSRFVASEEAGCHEAFKRAVVAADAEATVLALKKLIPVRLLRNSFAERILAAEAQGDGSETLMALLGQGRSKLGMFDGDVDEGELEIGQIAGLLRDVQPVSAIIGELMAEYRRAVAVLMKSVGE